jgi:hypothetical protein
MNHQTAPACPSCCQPSGQLLGRISLKSYVDYFQCAKCGYVWRTAKCLKQPGQDGPGEAAPRHPESGRHPDPRGHSRHR